MRTVTLLAVGALLAAPARAGDNEVRKALKDTEVHSSWVYNDLAAGLAKAKKSGKPLLVLFR
jgi:hypothetical protein